jgi:hypothetical protein
MSQTKTILARSQAHFESSKLKELVAYQTRIGLRKYGQTLDYNPQPLESRIRHALQEVVDLVQYLEWVADGLQKHDDDPERVDQQKVVSTRAAEVAQLGDWLVYHLPADYDLTPKEGFRELT